MVSRVLASTRGADPRRGDRPLDEPSTGGIAAARRSRRRSAGPILYAAVWQASSASRGAGDPEHDPERERWAWRFPIRPLVVVRDLDEAPPSRRPGSSRRASGATRTSG